MLLNKQLKFKIEGGKLTPVDGAVMNHYIAFLKNFKDGDIIEMYLEHHTYDKTNIQLAKLYVCMKELASFTGHSLADIKTFIKDETGLFISQKDIKTNEITKIYRSFADCSKDEVSASIQTCITMGAKVGCHLD